MTTHAPHRAAPRSAFTLIELLVVISIITLLIAILMPALQGAKKQSSQVKCAANLWSLGTGLETYLSEFDYTFPINGVLFPKPGGSNTAPTDDYDHHGETNMQKWDLPYGALWNYVSANRKTYLCPDDDFMRPGTGNSNQLPLQRNSLTGAISPGGGPNGYWSYSVNTVLNSEGQFRSTFSPRGGTGLTQQPWNDPLRTLNIARPADFVYFIEEDVKSPFNDEVFDAPAYNGGDKLTNRHNNGGNIGFADRHVEWVSEVVFNLPPSATGLGGVDHWTAMQSVYTRWFFPDGGTFASPP
jgi:prepilin-type N-terminal cleavage/methylation domain-containing protein/prepilin-type processing-associated H-X9-DG protein